LSEKSFIFRAESNEREEQYKQLAKKFAKFVEMHGIDTISGKAYRVARTRFMADAPEEGKYSEMLQSSMQLSHDPSVSSRSSSESEALSQMRSRESYRRSLESPYHLRFDHLLTKDL